MPRKKVEVSPIAETNVNETARVVTIPSVVDGKLSHIEGYLTDVPLNKNSKLIRYQDDGLPPSNKFFTKK